MPIYCGFTRWSYGGESGHAGRGKTMPGSPQSKLIIVFVTRFKKRLKPPGRFPFISGSARFIPIQRGSSRRPTFVVSVALLLSKPGRTWGVCRDMWQRKASDGLICRHFNPLANPGCRVRPPPSLTAADRLFMPQTLNFLSFLVASLAIHYKPYFNRNMAFKNMLKMIFQRSTLLMIFLPPRPHPMKVKSWICHCNLTITPHM